jgi:peptidylprolyl isomerase
MTPALAKWSALSSAVVVLVLSSGAWRWLRHPASAADSRLQRAPQDVAAPAAAAEHLASGVASRVLQPGHGDLTPGLDDLITVHSATWSRDGVLLGDTRATNTPHTQVLGQLWPGLVEVAQRMRVGEQRRIWIPAKLTIRPGDDDDERRSAPLDLTVDLALLAIKQAPKLTAAHPPSGAVTTASGLTYVLARRDSNAPSPGPADRISFFHAAWTESGRLFENSRFQPQPQSARVTELLPGLREGVQLMHVGDRAQFWLPARLAYGERPSRRVPHGPMVFELELTGIERAGQ